MGKGIVGRPKVTTVVTMIMLGLAFVVGWYALMTRITYAQERHDQQVLCDSLLDAS